MTANPPTGSATSFSPLLVPNRAGHLRVWDEPVDDLVYVIGADVAEGRVKERQTHRIKKAAVTVDRPDYSAAVVLERESGQHVATWHGYMPPIHFAASLAALGWYYNRALIVPEINGPGLGVVEQLVRVISYPQIYTSKIFGMEIMEMGEVSYGWRTTGPTRAILINRIEEVLHNGQLLTRDAKLAKELRTLQYDDMGVPRARGSDKDDLVLALGLALQGRYESLAGTTTKVSEPSKPAGPDARVWQKRKLELDRAERLSNARTRLRARTFLPGDGLRASRRFDLPSQS